MRRVVIVGDQGVIDLRIAALLAASTMASAAIERGDEPIACGPGPSIDLPRKPRAPRTLAKHQAMAKKGRR